MIKLFYPNNNAFDKKRAMSSWMRNERQEPTLRKYESQ